MVGARLVDQLHLVRSDFLIQARAVFGDGLLRSHRAANGFALLMLLRGARHGRAGEGSGQTGAKSTAICAILGTGRPISWPDGSRQAAVQELPVAGRITTGGGPTAP